MLVGMVARDQMRAADGDRERYAERVRDALAEGRLELGEMDERLQQVYRAKTFGELDQLVADLPGPVAPQRSQLAPVTTPAKVPASRHEENPKLAGWLTFLWRLWLVTVMVNLVIWFVASLASSQVLYFWPIWVAGPWGAVNVALMILFPPRRRS
jgi:hypothetical protein